MAFGTLQLLLWWGGEGGDREAQGMGLPGNGVTAGPNSAAFLILCFAKKRLHCVELPSQAPWASSAVMLPTTELHGIRKKHQVVPWGRACATSLLSRLRNSPVTAQALDF